MTSNPSGIFWRISMARRPSSRKTLKDIMESKEIVTDGDLNATALLMRKILHEMSIKPLEWENLTTTFYKKKHGDDIRKIREEKGNLAAALEADQLTWSRFEQVIQILGADSADFSVKLNYPRGISVDCNINLRYKRRGSKSGPEVSVMVDRLINNCEDKE